MFLSEDGRSCGLKLAIMFPASRCRGPYSPCMTGDLVLSGFDTANSLAVNRTTLSSVEATSALLTKYLSWSAWTDVDVDDPGVGLGRHAIVFPGSVFSMLALDTDKPGVAHAVRAWSH